MEALIAQIVEILKLNWAEMMPFVVSLGLEIFKVIDPLIEARLPFAARQVYKFVVKAILSKLGKIAIPVIGGGAATAAAGGDPLTGAFVGATLATGYYMKGRKA